MFMILVVVELCCRLLENLTQGCYICLQILYGLDLLSFIVLFYFCTLVHVRYSLPYDWVGMPSQIEKNAFLKVSILKYYIINLRQIICHLIKITNNFFGGMYALLHKNRKVQRVKHTGHTFSVVYCIFCTYCKS